MQTQKCLWALDRQPARSCLKKGHQQEEERPLSRHLQQRKVAFSRTWERWSALTVGHLSLTHCQVVRPSQLLCRHQHHMWTNCLIISTKKPCRETLVRPACSVRIFSQRNLRSSIETQSVIARDAVNQSVKFAATRSEFCQRQILHLSESAIYATSKWTTTSLSKTLKRSKLHQETKLNS